LADAAAAAETLFFFFFSPPPRNVDVDLDGYRMHGVLEKM